jgi:hypothetical protein
VNEFIEECRKEWRRLGVPDPIANEMAADLTADIDEAESEGGSAEDVLGNSLFDPQRFAASWAGARGVTSPPTPIPGESPRRRWVVAAMLAVFAFLALGALLLAIGRHSASAAVSVRRILGPGSVHWFGPSPAAPPVRYFVPGPFFAVGHSQGLAIIAAVVLLVGIVALGLAVLYLAPWTRRNSKMKTPVNQYANAQEWSTPMTGMPRGKAPQ